MYDIHVFVPFIFRDPYLYSQRDIMHDSSFPEYPGITYVFPLSFSRPACLTAERYRMHSLTLRCSPLLVVRVCVLRVRLCGRAGR